MTQSEKQAWDMPLRRFLFPLLALSLLGATGQEAPTVAVVRTWLKAVLDHRPGEVDHALVAAAAIPAAAYKTMSVDVERLLRQDFRSPLARDDVRRRAALLHMDIALLLPDQAATLKPSDVVPLARSGQLDRFGQPVAKPPGASLVYLVDGQYVTSGIESGHWPFASRLLAGVTDASTDEFVRRWYRAVAAVFLWNYRFGNAVYHIGRAREALPHDPVILLFSGALNEALASGRVRAGAAAPAPALELVRGQIRGSSEDTPTEKDLLRASERDLRDAVKYGAPLEAYLRLGRVAGRLGKHDEAVQLLNKGVGPAGDPRLAYFRELFLGTEYKARGRLEEARASFERAAAVCPAAQTPLIALSDVLRRSGSRDAAVEVLRRLEALPADASARADPWWEYHRSYAADADAQLAGVRAWRGTR